MADLYNIFIRSNRDVTRNQVEEKLNLAIDWFRYADYCYLVYTSKDISTWKARLKPFVEPNGHLFIINVDPNEYNGWMPKNLWPWIEDKKKKMNGESK